MGSGAAGYALTLLHVNILAGLADLKNGQIGFLGAAKKREYGGEVELRYALHLIGRCADEILRSAHTRRIGLSQTCQKDGYYAIPACRIDMGGRGVE